MRRKFSWLALALFLPLPILAQSLAEFEKRVTQFTLANGMQFVVLERHQAPVASFYMHVNAGAADDPAGRTGVAHMFEHMIGKGTPALGTQDYPREKEALDAVEAVYDKLESERNKGVRANPRAVEGLQAQLSVAIDQAKAYVDPNAYVRVIERNGAVGFNAGTRVDSTAFFYSLPANRVELWFLLQSQWLKQPVFREFYKERDVVRNERRERIESNPRGELQEMLMATAFAAHPYRNLGAGWASDIENLRVGDARAFFALYYVPGNITVAVAGDVNPAEVRRLAEKYFGGIPAGAAPPRVRTVEPRQEGEKRVAVETPSQPLLLLGYKRPGQYDKDDLVFDVLGSILSSGRTGLLYKELVRDKRIALVAVAAPTMPGGRYPCLFVIFTAPTPGHTIDENAKAVYAILDRLKREKVDAATLDRAKTKLRGGFIRQLDNNSGLAAQLATHQAFYGDWRRLFTAIGEIRKVTAEDVQRVTQEYLSESSRTVAYTVAPKAASGGGSR